MSFESDVMREFEFDHREEVEEEEEVKEVKEVMPLGKNLIKNHSGDDGTTNWRCFVRNFVRYWKVIDHPWLIPNFPRDPILDEAESCFVYSSPNANGYKYQKIYLPDIGFSKEYMDTNQPPIEVSVWYTCTEDSFYEIRMYLGDDQKIFDHCKIIFQSTSLPPTNDEWHKVLHLFKGYGKGVSKIWIEDRGSRLSKSAGTCVRILKPE